METGNTSSHNNVVVYNRLPIGTVIRKFVDNTNPPKIKIFVIVGYENDSVVTAYFNSDINMYINYTQELQDLHIPFQSAGKSYLTHNCYCDCSQVLLFNKDTLHEAVKNSPAINLGQMEKEDIDRIMTMLMNSTNIRGAHKRRYGFYDYQLD